MKTNKQWETWIESLREAKHYWDKLSIKSATVHGRTGLPSWDIAHDLWCIEQHETVWKYSE